MYQHTKPDNLVELFENSVKKFPDNLLFGTRNSEGTSLSWLTYRETAAGVDRVRGALAQLGISKGDSVGIISNNRSEWAIIAFAAYGRGARYVPMYESELLTIWKYIITDSAVKVLFVSKPEIYEKIKNFINDISTLEKIYIIEDDGDQGLASLEKIGGENPVESIKPETDDVACLVYTSGTTGDPKGVLLTHGNFTSNVKAGNKMFSHLDDTARSISILPWAHSFGQTAELYHWIYIGGSIGFIGSVETLADDLQLIKPDFIIGVPRVYNRIYNGIWARMEEEGGAKKKLFVSAVEAAKKKRELETDGKSSLSNNLKLKILDKLVFSKIRDRFGGMVKQSLTGSATMNVDIANFFWDIGIEVYDCYGLSETSPAITMNSPQKYKLGTVGRPIEGVRVEIDKSVVEDGAIDGEIICYGPNVMKGYHNKPEATEAVMTDDGGFRTGDRGRLDDDGFLYITGRIKEQYKLENGKYVFPASIEEEIKLMPEVANAMVYGDGKAYNVCLVYAEPDTIKRYALSNSISGEYKDLIHNNDIQNMVAEKIRAFLENKFGGYEIPRKFSFIEDDFTQENGMLTPTMKLKRRNVMEQYKSDVEKLYQK